VPATSDHDTVVTLALAPVKTAWTTAADPAASPTVAATAWTLEESSSAIVTAAEAVVMVTGVLVTAVTAFVSRTVNDSLAGHSETESWRMFTIPVLCERDAESAGKVTEPEEDV